MRAATFVVAFAALAIDDTSADEESKSTKFAERIQIHNFYQSFVNLVLFVTIFEGSASFYVPTFLLCVIRIKILEYLNLPVVIVY